LRRKEWLNDRIRSLVVGLNSRKILQIVSNSPPKGIVLFFIRVKSLEVVEMLGNNKVKECHIAKGKRLVTNKIFEIFKLRSGFFQLSGFKILVIFIC